jgi:hypothetical protein
MPKKLEVIDVIEAFPDLSWNMKNVIKYALRPCKPTDGTKEKDLRKIINYTHREITGEWLDKDSPTYSIKITEDN